MPKSAPVILKNPWEGRFSADFLQQFEAGLDTLQPDRSAVPARVLGYGEISTVFEIETPETQGLAFKRLAVFDAWDEIEAYRRPMDRYNELLSEGAGVNLPKSGYMAVANPAGRPILYIIQAKLPREGLVTVALSGLPDGEAMALIEHVYAELAKIWRFNGSDSRWNLAIDGQLSNWAFEAADSRAANPDRLVYLDTSTPIFKEQGVEQMNSELFLRNAPAPLAWVIRKLFLQEVLDRYYEPRSVLMDLIANLYKERQVRLVPEAIRKANALLEHESLPGAEKPLEEAEIQSYYRSDAFIWSFYLAARRIDRFVQRRLLGRKYPYILPGRIQR